LTARFVSREEITMTSRLNRVALTLAVLLVGLLPLTAAAGSITYTESFMATGTVNGNPFSGNVSFTFLSDTNQIIDNCLGIGGLFCTPNGTAGVSIQGVGVGTFANQFFVFDNQGNSVAGFSAIGIEDIVDLSNSAFATYDLKSPIGPLTTTFFFTDNGVQIGSSLGNIVFDSFSGTPTFTASTGGGTTPEPGSFVLFGSGLAGLATVLRRKLWL
jgi:hypothetical protein